MQSVEWLLHRPAIPAQSARRRSPRHRPARRPARRRRCGTGSALLLVLGLVQAVLPDAGRPAASLPEFKAAREERRGRRGHDRRSDDPRHAEEPATATRPKPFTTTRVEDPKLTEELEAQGREVHRRGDQPLAARAARLDHAAALPRRHLGLLLPPHGRRRRRRDVVRAQQGQDLRRRRSEGAVRRRRGRGRSAKTS